MEVCLFPSQMFVYKPWNFFDWEHFKPYPEFWQIWGLFILSKTDDVFKKAYFWVILGRFRLKLGKSKFYHKIWLLQISAFTAF